MKEHHPPHLFLDETWYLVTAATCGHDRLLASEQAKVLVRDALNAAAAGFAGTVLAWVLLDDHYHLLLKPRRGRDLPCLFALLHGGTARRLNLQASAPGRQVWHNYWDTCVRGEQDLWTRFNYVHHNPVKHGYVGHPGEWPYSSYRFYLRTRGQEWLEDCWLRYPAIDYMEGDSGPWGRPVS